MALDFDMHAALESFRINSLLTPLLVKHLRPYFSRTREQIFASLSAMVGSIEENKIGGWMSYRASKAALNMYIKTISIEFKNSGFKTRFVAIHPGTTETLHGISSTKKLNHKASCKSANASRRLNNINLKIQRPC